MDVTKLASNGDYSRVDTSYSVPGQGYLDDWHDSQPDNYFLYDLELQRSLEMLWGKARYSEYAGRLAQFGGVLATEVEQAAQTTANDQNLPRLERYDSLGHRIEEVIYHPAHHIAGRHIYGSGIVSAYSHPGNNLLALTLFYLSAQNGEAGHNCSVACTAGLIKILQAVGNNVLKEKFLPDLLNPDYDNHYQGAQFLTELQGGSDVGANSVTATPLDATEGAWLLNGDKWFCSNISADLALVTARVENQGSGTRGLGLFLLPRLLENGRPNNMAIKRLKEKLGTRSLATAEVEFQNALAYNVGSTKDGFKNVMTHVINTSRIYNAIAVSGCARRAYVTARTFAQHRPAFGQTIIHFPLVQASLAHMRADSSAIRAGSLFLASILDKKELGDTDQNTDGFLRMAINLNKYRSSLHTSKIIARGIELLGGNGAIETFSILPRLFRDNIVYENWEGTHNVLLAQVHRDIRRYRIDKPFMAVIEDMLLALADESLHETTIPMLPSLEEELREVMAMDDLTGAIYFRPLMDRLTDMYYVACLASEGEWEKEEKKDRTKLRLAKLFFDQHVLGLEPREIPYYDDQVSRLCQ